MGVSYFYHINKLNGIKTPLHFIGLYCDELLPPQEILNNLQKIILECNKYLPDLPNVKILNLYGNFTKIPNFKGLLELKCSECSELIQIPNIIGLKKLDCSCCDNLTEIPNIVGLKILNCYFCNKLTEIPHIVGLLELDCSNCNIIEIPHIVGLLELNCHHCYNLSEIPNIKGLLELDYSYCANLTEIPNIIGLKKCICDMHISWEWDLENED